MPRNLLPKLIGEFFEPGYKYIKDFPIPRPNLADGTAKAQYDRMVVLVEQMLEFQQRLQEAGDNREKERLSEEIEQLDGRIDQLVYGLYGLSGEEIALVEKEIEPRLVKGEL